MIDLDNLIKSKYVAPFMVIGITGSVAVGKSTFAHDLADKLSQQNIKTTVISTDDFLMSNDELHERGLFDQKGFPQTYNLDLLEKVITRFRAGKSHSIFQFIHRNLRIFIQTRHKLLNYLIS